MTSSSILVAITVLGACVTNDEPRCRPGLTPVSVVTTEIRDHYVRLDLEYGGGCEPHELAVWWTGNAAP